MFKDSIHFLIKHEADGGGQGGRNGDGATGTGTGDGAGAGQTGSGTGDDGNGSGNDDDNDGKLSLTQDELYKIITNRIDRFKADQAKEVEAKKNQANRYKGMTDAEKAEAKVEELRKENAELQKSFQRTQMSAQARASLSEAGINANDDMVNILIADSAEQTLENVKLFQNQVKEAAEKLWNKSRQGKTPGNGGVGKQPTNEKSFGAQMREQADARKNTNGANDAWAKFQK